MKLRRVDPNTILVPEVRVTARFDSEMWSMFQKSVKDAGIVTPIICCETDDGLVLVDGAHRLNEALENKLPRVDVAIMPGDMVEVLTLNLFLDHMRGKTPVSEMVNVIEALWKEYDLDSEKIAVKTGMTRDYVEKLQKISELTPHCRQALDEERIKVGHAAALTRVKDPIKQETILYQLFLYNWTVKELEEYVNTVLATMEEQEAIPPSEEPRKPPELRCFYCREVKGVLELANPNTCTECSGVLITSINQARAEMAEETRRREAELARQKNEASTPEKTE